jgi:glutamyl-tRNA reductase
MSILVVSVSHKTAPIDFLAQLAMDAPAAAKFTDDLMSSEHLDEAVVLSTCNRTEIYASVSRFHGGLDQIAATLAGFAGLSVPDLQARCSVFFDEGAVAHTFAVAAGLDSLVVGENQILGQVRSALTQAQANGSVGTVLNSLFQQAIRVGKRVHTETSVGSAGRSLVSAAYERLAAQHTPLEGQRVLILGAGAMATLAARTAVANGATVTCVSRTLDRAHRLASAVDGRARSIADLPAVLQETDVVVACAGARGVLVRREELVDTPVRAVVDLALPADVAEDVVDLGVILVNLERLVADRSDLAAVAGVEAARDLVQSEVSDFLALRRSAAVAPTVVALRSMASEVVAAELARLDLRLPGLTERDRREVSRTVRRVVDKLLHAPTVRVQELAAGSPTVDYAAALRELFALDPQAVAAVMSPEVPR